MRTQSLGPSVELPMEPRRVVLGGGNACECRHWGLRWSTLWGHEALHWVGEPHADTATEAFNGTPNGAAKGGGAACGHIH
eukprot:9283192-Pyramimonas_sp.AAC.1